jgi:DNA invertase Pin-like site-specific DNA recombinase
MGLGLDPNETMCRLVVRLEFPMSLVGYARVSSVGQSLDVQLDQLREAGCEKVFAEKRSGRSQGGREQLAAALEWVREGDVLVVTRLDRLARSMSDLRLIVDQLTAKGVGFKALQQGVMDTTKSEGRLMLNILASFAEFEADIRKERQADGIAKAKAAGVYQGRPATIDAGEVAKLKAEGVGPAEIARRLKIGRASVYRVLGAAS